MYDIDGVRFDFFKIDQYEKPNNYKKHHRISDILIVKYKVVEHSVQYSGNREPGNERAYYFATEDAARPAVPYDSRCERVEKGRPHEAE